MDHISQFRFGQSAVGDVPGNQTTTAVLVVGETVNGTIDWVDDEDWYAINLIAGQNYYFTLSGSGPDESLDPHLSLVGFKSDNNSGIGNGAYFVFKAETTGVHYLKASGEALRSGAYTLAAGLMPADDVPGDVTTTAVLSNDGRTTGILQTTSSNEVTEDKDWFTGTFSANVTYEIRVAGASVNGLGPASSLLFEIYAGADVFSSFSFRVLGEGANTGYFTPYQTGTWYGSIQRGDYSSGLTPGGYEITIRPVDADIDAAGAVRLTLGQQVSSLLAVPSDTDSFTLNLTAGQSYLFYVESENSQPFRGTLSVGGQTVNGDGYNAPAIRYTAAYSGDHTIVLAGSVDTYILGSEVAGADIGATVATATSLSIDSVANSYFETTRDRDWYAVQLTSGQTYMFTLESRFGYYSESDLNLVRSNGTVLATGQQPGEQYIVYTPTSSGTYYLIAKAESIAHYTISATSVADAHGQTNASAQPLSIGEVFHGSIDFYGDEDWFSAQVVSGYTYIIEVSSNNGNDNFIPIYKIHDSNGQPLSRSNFISEKFIPTFTGQIFIHFSELNEFEEISGYSARLSLVDTVSANVDTEAFMDVGQVYTGAIEIANDHDWIAIRLEAGQSYNFQVNGNGPTLAAPILNLRNADGSELEGGNVENGEGAQIQYTIESSGIYYLDVGPYYLYLSGSYSVSASLTSDVFGHTHTHHQLVPDSTYTSGIDTTTDQDWFKITVTAGQSYFVTVSANGGGGLNDAQLSVYRSDTSMPFYVSSDGLGSSQTALRFTAKESGTYYVVVEGTGGATGDYRVAANSVSAQDPLATIDSGRTQSDSSVSVYFATVGESHAGYSSDRSWTVAEKNSFMAAAATWSQYTNVSFVQAGSSATADLIVTLDNVDAFLALPGSAGGPVIAVIDTDSLTGSIAAGTLGYVDFLRATGHALGLSSPYGWSPTHEPMEGLTTPDNPGASGLNKSVYTVMGSTISTNVSLPFFGNPASGMALDIALLQQKYGSTSHNEGNTTYSFPQTFGSGYVTIWDTGGVDTLTIVGGGAHLDLRAAELTGGADSGAGGYFSSVGVFSNGFLLNHGFVIAHGVVIENATGDDYDDGLFGNAADNVLLGNGGNDRLAGGNGNDIINGGNGIDTVSFLYALQGATVNLNLATAQNTGEGLDTLLSIENFEGSAYDDVVNVSAATTSLYGGQGIDTVIFSGNYAEYTFSDTSGFLDTGYIISRTGETVSAISFEKFQFADRTITLDDLLYLNTRPYTGGDLFAFIAQGGIYTLKKSDVDFRPASEVIYSAYDVYNGTIWVNGQSSTTFTSTQIEAGQVSFRHTGNNTGASFKISASNSAGTAPGTYVMAFSIIASPGVIIEDSSAGSRLVGTAARDIISGNGGDDYIIGGGGNDALGGGDGFDVVDFSTSGHAINNPTMSGFEKIIGSSFNDIFYLDQGNTIIDGGLGADTMNGSLGNDTYYVDNIGDLVIEDAQPTAYGGIDTVFSSISITLFGGTEHLTLTGTEDLNATGNNFHNIINGNVGNNILNGGSGPDLLAGGIGNDTYYTDHILDEIVELSNQGTDTVVSTLSLTLGSNIENLTLTGFANVNATGNGLANVLRGNSGNNILTGGVGNDTYYVQNTADKVIEFAGQGTDLVLSTVTFALGTGQSVEILELTGTADLSATGNELNNRLTGNSGTNVLTGHAGNDVLDGHSGADLMMGGNGNDTFYVDNVGDRITESDGQGIDTVFSTVTLSVVTQAVENITLTGTAHVDITANSLNNLLTGNSGNNSLNGRSGADTMVGGMGNDTYYIDAAGDRITEASGEGTDTVVSTVTVSVAAWAIENVTLTGAAHIDITGNGLDNILTGNSGNNSLNGRTGADRMIGGQGNDTYYVDNALDRVTETDGQGTDTVFSTISFSVSAQAVENVTLTGSTDSEAIGNSLANVLTGNTGNNSLNGRVGADTLIGGAGHDIYYVDNLGDVVTELAGQGVDTIVTSLSYSLAGLFVEKLTLNGSAGNSATGNQFNNIITGNGGNNLIDGGTGADRMYGALGNDTVVIDDVNDKPGELAGEGYDTLMTSVTFSVAAQAFEAIILTGSGHIDMVANPLDNVITGNSGNNVLNGRSGNDTLNGGAGNDTLIGSTGNDILTGGLGADIFLFHKKPGVDTVKDFDKLEGDTLNLNDITMGLANASIVTQSGSDVVIDFGGGHILTIEDAVRADVLTQMVW